MPRKVFHGLDYDEEYDTHYDYDDYDYDHEEERDDQNYDDYIEGNEKPLMVDKIGSKPGVWQCSICTYENNETCLFCDMCGAVQESAMKYSNSKVNGVLGGSGSPATAMSYIAEASTAASGRDTVHGDLPTKKASGSVQSASSIKGKEVIAMPSPDNDMLEQPPSRLPKANWQSESESSLRGRVDSSQTLTKNIHLLKLNKNPINNGSVESDSQYKPEKWMLLDQEQGGLNQLNLAIVGHVDSGKSTLSGRLLQLLGRISKKDMHKYEKEAKAMGKGSFAYAWAMDESSTERERGVTMTVAVAYFDSKKFRVVLLDSPGHKDFVPNMISGATQADAAILVVDASIGSFEAGMDGNGLGQTKEHAQLIRSFGVEQIIVAVNKMDVVDYSMERFNFIQSQLGSFLRLCGFKDSSISWIPLSAMENQNLVATTSDSRLSGWYQGLCLLDAIDSLQTPPRDALKPLILPICDVIKSSMGQVAASGKLETGAIRNGSKVLVMPPAELATVRSIERDSTICSVARAGDNVAVTLQGIELGHVIPGGVLCHPDFPLPVATNLELKILVLDITTPILNGSQVEFHLHHAKTSAKVVRMLALLDQKTGKVSKTAPRILKAKQSAMIEVELDEQVCVDEFSKCRALGRAFLRSSGSTVAVGIVTRVL